MRMSSFPPGVSGNEPEIVGGDDGTFLRLAPYRSGSRFVVIEVWTTTAGSEVVFGPDSREACEEWMAEDGREIENQPR